MLVLSRKTSERIKIGKDIYLTVVEIRGNKVRLGIEAPKNVTVDREEVAELKSCQEFVESLRNVRLDIPAETHEAATLSDDFLGYDFYESTLNPTSALHSGSPL